jgi:osmotically-inducible protein OsmY
MVKEHFGMGVCRTAAILSALLCGQGQAFLFAQQSAQPVADQPNTASAPNQTQTLSAAQRRDQDLRREIQQQFATDAACQSIQVNVTNGVVVLEGHRSHPKETVGVPSTRSRPFPVLPGLTTV